LNLTDFTNKYCPKPSPWPALNWCKSYKCWTGKLLNWRFVFDIPPGFEIYASFCIHNGRQVWINNERLVAITQIIGEIRIESFGEVPAFKTYMEQCRKFYKIK